jgi:hypothetical protein
VVVVARDGTDLEGLLAAPAPGPQAAAAAAAARTSEDGGSGGRSGGGGGRGDESASGGLGRLLADHREHIIVVRDPVPNAVSSTRVREELEAGRSAAYLSPAPVLRYALEHGLYTARPRGARGGGATGGGARGGE